MTAQESIDQAKLDLKRLVELTEHDDTVIAELARAELHSRTRPPPRAQNLEAPLSMRALPSWWWDTPNHDRIGRAVAAVMSLDYPCRSILITPDGFELEVHSAYHNQDWNEVQDAVEKIIEDA